MIITTIHKEQIMKNRKKKEQKRKTNEIEQLIINGENRVRIALDADEKQFVSL